MTTSYTAYKTGETIIDVASGNPATPFDCGAGHVDPMAALDPGLVYDNAVEDYFSFLCALNYSSTEIKLTTHRDFTCDTSKKYRFGDFNYPSFVVPLETSSGRGGGTGASTTVKYTRTLTNVGTPGTYKVTITSQAPSVKILVEPQSLTFSQAYSAGQIRMLGVYMQRSWIIFASDTSLAVLSPIPGAQILQAVSTVGPDPSKLLSSFLLNRTAMHGFDAVQLSCLAMASTLLFPFVMPSKTSLNPPVFVPLSAASLHQTPPVAHGAHTRSKLASTYLSLQRPRPPGQLPRRPPIRPAIKLPIDTSTVINNIFPVAFSKKKYMWVMPGITQSTMSAEIGAGTATEAWTGPSSQMHSPSAETTFR
ncbi:hypothetical protein ACFX1S_022613 [Malus domestica]